MIELIHIPVVHSPQDLGSFLEKARTRYIEEYGIDQWDKHLNEIENLWKEIQKRLYLLPIDFNKVKVFQDGLPVCGKEYEIVEKLANAGSINHQILLELARRGATIVGTESPELLIKERENAGAVRELPHRYDEILEERDRFITQRIISTLTDGDFGILFIGALHRVIEKLPDSILITKLF